MIIFQFHKGAIRTTIQAVGCTHHLDFNSIKVRLELLLPLQTCSPLLHFNSIKVRLEPKNGFCHHVFARFQFHKGAIRTLRPKKWFAWMIYFNSIKVRLEPLLLGNRRRLHLDFNSIKVRLELRDFFRFRGLRYHFNSIKVRLEHDGSIIIYFKDSISIP